jgi:hypothetical protein
MQKPQVFLDSRRYGSDCCAQEAKDAQNSAIYSWTSFQHLQADCKAPNMRSPDFQYEHPNLRARIGYGVADGCAVDSYSALRNDPNQMTRDRCRIQLFERIFQGVPNLKPGVPAPEKEMPLQQGISSTTLEGVQFSCKKSIMELRTNNPTPLLDCMKDIQTAETTVEPWIRGGDNTRDFVRRQEFLKNCGRQFSAVGSGRPKLH